MKKIFSFLLATVIACAGTSAQYCPEKEGQILKFTVTDNDNKVQDEYSAVVESVKTDAKGVMSVRVKESHQIPDNPLGGTVDVFNGYRFNPADTMTTVVLMGADDFKDMLLKQIKEMATAAGQMISDMDMKQLEESTRVKGELEIFISGAPTDGQLFEKSTMRTSLMGQNIIMRTTKGTYLGNETLETPAGKYDCVKLSYVMKNTGMGNAPDAYITAWYAKGIGMVKMIQSDKKGKDASTTLLVGVQ